MNTRAAQHEDDGPGAAGPQVVRREPVTTAVVRGHVPFAELRDFFDSAFGTLGRVLREQGVTPLGAAFALHHGTSGEKADLEVGFPTDRAVREEAGVVAATLPGGRVARLTHHGAFDGLGASWERLGTWMRDRGLARGEDRWEEYTTQPSPDMDPRDLRTELHWTIAN
ncbi:GyrI-like domain-containing protein [Streptomyces sp. NPDC092359]|uniref:GyrI-like domain-containing protein n=1 Tax=Streptomyces sp. NPDC092359 TaxID=3366014 RepID=UPI0037F36FF0